MPFRDLKNQRIPFGWRCRYFLYRHGPQIGYIMLGIGCFLALIANTALYKQQQEANKRQDADRERVEALVRESNAGRAVGTRLLCEIAHFIEKRANESDDLDVLHSLSSLRCGELRLRP